jgi:hypothetical protein
MVLKHFFLLILLVVVKILSAQVAKSLTVNAGELGTALTHNEKNATTNLTLTGTIDARDFRFMRDEMPALAVLDLRAVTIEGYAGGGGTLIDTDFYIYPANAIPTMAFWRKSTLTTLVLPLLASILQDYAFLDCQRLTIIENFSPISSIGAYAFNNCKSISALTIPPSVTRIKLGAFFGCSGLTKVSIHNQVVAIDENGFMGCSRLPVITIPASVDSIGKKAFADCTALKAIYVERMTPVDLTASASVFAGVDKSTCVLYVPFGSKDDYEVANQWMDFLHIVEFNAIVLSPSSLQFAFYGGEDSVSVTTLGDWSASSEQSWLKVSPLSGNSSQKMKITVLPNDKDSIRTATVTVTARSAEAQKLFVTQAANVPAFLVVSAAEETISSVAGSEIEVTVSSNVHWWGTTDGGWLTPDTLHSVGRGTISFTALANEGLAPRSATLTFSAVGVPDQKLTVTQAPKPYLQLMTDTLYIGKEEGSYEFFNLTATIAWKAISNRNWLSIDPGNGIGSQKIRFSVNDNPLLEKRSALVAFSGEGVDTKHLTVIQVAYDNTLTVSDNTLWLNYGEGNNETVKVFTTKKWTAHSNADWLTISAENFTGNALINLNAEPNPTMHERVTTIEVKANDSFSQFITVTQAAGQFNLLVSENQVQFNSRENGSAQIEITSTTNWTVAADQNWLSIDKTTGNGNGQLTITVAANATGAERTGFVIIYASNGVMQPIRIVQSGNKVGVQELNDQELTIYPNPFTNGFQLKGITEITKVELVDMSGRSVFVKEVCANEYISTGSLPRGVYQLRVITDVKVCEKKLICLD